MLMVLKFNIWIKHLRALNDSHPPIIKRYIDQLYGTDEIIGMICDPLTTDISSKVTKSQQNIKKECFITKEPAIHYLNLFSLREQELECILSTCSSTWNDSFSQNSESTDFQPITMSKTNTICK